MCGQVKMPEIIFQNFNVFFNKRPFTASFSFQYSWQLTVFNKTLRMTGLELWTFDEKSDALPTKPQPLPQHFNVILQTVTFINLNKNLKK